MKLRATFNGKSVAVKDVFNDFTKKVGRKAIKVIVQAASETADAIKFSTPIDTGNTAANWTIGLNGFTMPYDEEITDAFSPVDISRLADIKKTDTITISNSAPATRPLEYGYSKQAPNGMVRINLKNWNSRVKRIAAEMRG